MHKYVSFNQQIFSASQPTISAISTASLYGKGVFTTLAIYNSSPFLWEKHWRRLEENSAKLGIDLSEFTEQCVFDSLLEIIAKNKVENGRVRLTFFDESARGIWQFESEKKTSILITTADFRELSEIKLTISPYRINSTSPLVNIKSCNYLENLLALEEAKKRGFDEAIRLNERGEIVSATMANIFWIKDDQIYTPSLETGCLAGTTREFLLEKYQVFEVIETSDILDKIEGIFLSSAGLGIKPAYLSENKVNSLKNLDLSPIHK